MEQFTPQVVHTEAVEKMSTVEQEHQLAKKIEHLHGYFEDKIRQIDKETDIIWNKYKDILATYTTGGQPNPVDFMSTEDAQKYLGFKQQEAEFYHKINETIVGAVDLLCENNDADWEKLPSRGKSGTLADTHQRRYQLKLGDGYSILINWESFPEDNKYIFDTYPNLRESYSASIEGTKEVVTSKGIAGIGRKTKKSSFPLNTLAVVRGNENGFKPEEVLLKEFDETTTTKFQEQLLDLGRSLRERLE